MKRADFIKMNKWFIQKYCCDCKKQLGKKAQYNRTKRCQSCAAKKQFKNIKNHQKYIDGRTLKKYYCIDCKKEISRYDVKRCIHCSNIYLHKIGKLNAKGKNNGNYIDGSSGIYPTEFNSKLKKLIRNKDNYICQKCHKKGIDVHHIDYNKQNCLEDNLITLCNKCNLKVNSNRNYWFAYFKYIRGE